MPSASPIRIAPRRNGPPHSVTAISTTRQTPPAKRLISGKPGLSARPIQFGNATFAICTMISTTIMPEMIGARMKRANRPMMLKPLIEIVSAHQIRLATSSEP